MGEAKRKREGMTEAEFAAMEASRMLANKGVLIRSGWAIHLSLLAPKDMTEEQTEAMRKAFMCGAQHLWACIMGSLNEGSEPTPADERRMALINDELEAFAAEMARDHYPTKGSA